MGKRRLLFVSVGALLLAGCQTVQRPFNTELPPGTWKKRVSEWTVSEQGEMKAALGKLPNVGWYLAFVQVYVANAENGATTDQKIAVMNGILQREYGPHPGRSTDQSWARIRLAYLHALDRAWDECASKLADDLLGPEDSTWTAWRPASMPNDSIGNMLSAIVVALENNGHPTQRVEQVDKAINELADPPYPGHDAETAWAHIYLALRYAQTPPDVEGQAAGSIVDWIICELTMD